MLEEDEDVAAYSEWLLPSLELDNLWQSLVFDDGIEMKLLRYVETAILFSFHDINADLISWNRMVLLHGPPGTGKTSLCKALAQKLSIRLSQEYDFGHLIEINANNIFSKWFSESGKQLTRIFENVHNIIANSRHFVFLLIDEVESLAAARSMSLKGSEPSDSIRVRRHACPHGGLAHQSRLSTLSSPRSTSCKKRRTFFCSRHQTWLIPLV
eukprot:Partr_v1_DN28386_c2_g1_i1_m79760 putative thyroid hormone receptor interactor 13